MSVNKESRVIFGDFRSFECPIGDLMLVDPPYGINKKYEKEMEQNTFYYWVNELLKWSKCKRNIIIGGSFPKIYEWLPLIPKPNRILIWHRTFVLPNQRNVEWTYSITPILQYKTDDTPWYGPKRNDREWHDCIDSHTGMGDITRISKLFPDGYPKHPAVTGTSIVKKLLQGTTKEGDLVVDPMCGLGSTLVACLREKRIYWGCEINDKYYEFAIKWLNKELELSNT